MTVGFFQRILGGPVQYSLRPYRNVLRAVGALEEELQLLADGQLQERSTALRGRARDGVPLDALQVEGFALCREAARRVLGLRPYDVQVYAAIVLHRGQLAELATGEGKTLAAVLPAYLNALTGDGVHVLTFNDYLAKRDAGWMGPVHEFLGITVRHVQEDSSTAERRAAYAADITYVTAKQAGFDFLRDQLCTCAEDLVHRAFGYAIVDEADSILIDEARFPLVIAGSTDLAQPDHGRIAALVAELQHDEHYRSDEFGRNAVFTESGIERLEEQLGCGNLYEPDNLPLLSAVTHGVHAAVLLRRDVDYILSDGIVEIVDEFTGRVVRDRRWPHGLQAAVEAHEGVAVRPEGEIRGSLSLQHFLPLYPKVAGMTATAESAAREFEEFYGIRVVKIPSNCPCIRQDEPDVVFTHREAKRRALVREIQEVHATGRPILVGTASIAESEQLHGALLRAGVRCALLNARDDDREAEIIARAGVRGAVTISTNMAGRGIDIRLGGPSGQDHDSVLELGGLYVIGTQRHESLRIDQQLRGRAGRQGDPGSSRFFISLEDDLIRRYGVLDLLPAHYRTLRQDEPIIDRRVGRAIRRAQRIIEGQNFTIRHTLWKYAGALERQRQVIQDVHRELLRDGRSDGLLADQAPEQHARCVQRFGSEATRELEKQLTLLQVDRHWIEHLVQIARLRDGIHWRGVGGEAGMFEFLSPGSLDPYLEYRKDSAILFNDLQDRIDAAVVRSFQAMELSDEGLALVRDRLRGPASTWTYLISDNPFGSLMDTIFRNLFRALGIARTGLGPRDGQ